MLPQRVEAAGLEITALLPESAERATSAVRTGVVLLHGYAMEPADLAPFGASIGLNVPFFFPRGPLAAQSRGRAWWSVDEELRALSLQAGARDLFELYPQELEQTRATLVAAIRALMERYALERVVLGGFSQGGMLSCDTALRADLPLAGLILLSASCIAIDDWKANTARLAGLPAFVSHGRQDADLSFAAGERLYELATTAGARTTWLPFDGGHEIPLPVWRGLRRFLTPLL